MPSLFSTGLRVCWLAVGIYWLWSARRVKAAEQTEPFAKRLFAYWLPLLIAFLLLGPGPWYGHSPLREQFVPHTTAVYTTGLALCIAGTLLALWSRRILGSNWSGNVQLKQGHELIAAGPYRVVRHPIYSGLLLLFLGNAIMVGDWRGLLAVAIMFVSFWIKLRVEESWLGRRFGEAYQAYRSRTKALIPMVL